MASRVQFLPCVGLTIRPGACVVLLHECGHEPLPRAASRAGLALHAFWREGPWFLPSVDAAAEVAEVAVVAVVVVAAAVEVVGGRVACVRCGGDGEEKPSLLHGVACAPAVHSLK